MPERYRLFEKEPWHSRGLRQMPVDNFIVFYIPKTEDKIVNVIRVIYGGRNIDEQINDGIMAVPIAQDEREQAHEVMRNFIRRQNE